MTKSIFNIKIISFGYKYYNGPVVFNSNGSLTYQFDCRFIENPFYIDSLKNLTGLDEPVKKYFLNQSIVRNYIQNCLNLVRPLLSNPKKINKDIVIYFGCTGGQHRSVYCAQEFYDSLKSLCNRSCSISLEHTNIYTHKTDQKSNACLIQNN